MKIKLHSPYHHFPNHVPQEGDRYIDCYNDSFIMSEKPTKKSIALLIEPRPLQSKVYDYIEKHFDEYKYVFTHDSILLDKLPNAKVIIWGGIWVSTRMIKDFSHPISFVASNKGQAPLRIMRENLAHKLKGKIDTYGTFDGGEKVEPIEVYGKYPFSVVIENHIDDYWLTEKICNCFACSTVPIYYGARKVSELFDGDGIIECHSIDEVRTAVDYILVHAEQEYCLRGNAILSNRKTVQNYSTFEKWFFNAYGELLGGIL